MPGFSADPTPWAPTAVLMGTPSTAQIGRAIDACAKEKSESRESPRNTDTMQPVRRTHQWTRRAIDLRILQCSCITAPPYSSHRPITAKKEDVGPETNNA